MDNPYWEYDQNNIIELLRIGVKIYHKKSVKLLGYRLKGSMGMQS